MRTPAQVWAAVAEDPRWLDDPAAVVGAIMAEAHAAGLEQGRRGDAFAAGVDAAARAIEREGPRLPQCVGAMPRALARVVRELAAPAVAPVAAADAQGSPTPAAT